jgi:hypothetical protein
MEGFVLSLQFSDEEFPLLQDVSTLLYDLTLTHDFGALLTSYERPYYSFGTTFWYRNGRPVPRAEKIRAARVVKESPLLLEVVIPSLGALWILLQILEKVADRPLVREKLEREVTKLRREDASHRQTVSDMHVEFLRRLENDPAALRIAEQLEQRLRRNPIKLVAADITTMPPAANDDESEAQDEF